MNSQIDFESCYESKDSKLVIALMTLYMSTILLFSYHSSLVFISEIVFVLAFGGCSVYMMLHNKKFRIDMFLYLFLAFIIFCFVALAWSYDVNKSMVMILTLVQLFGLSVILFS